jgi:magnesium-transporting ATPase (P-type)
VLAAILKGVHFNILDREHVYLSLKGRNSAQESVLRFFTWFIIMSQMVPISLTVSGEVVKAIQSLLMQQDARLWDTRTRQGLKVQCSVLNEDLGQIEYVFSDKTGTLTRNLMEFKVASVGPHVFGSMETDISKRVSERLASSTVELPSRSSWVEMTANVEAHEERVAAATSSSAVFDWPAREEMLLHLLGDASFPSHSAAVSAATLPARIAAASGGSPIAHTPRSREAVRQYLLHLALNNTIMPMYFDQSDSSRYTQHFTCRGSVFRLC